MNVVLWHNTSEPIVFNDILDIVFRPDEVFLFKDLPEKDIFGDVEGWQKRTPFLTIKSQETAGRRYWNYNGTWYPEFQIMQTAQAIQLPLFETAQEVHNAKR